MSEYQCYEFVALDRPLTSKQIIELRAISTRAEITPARLERVSVGRSEGGRDLRVLDAHAGLGNIAFDRSPKLALVHYEMGVRIGELSLPADFDGLLVWGRLHNRAFLRCMHGYGLCLWRLGDFAAAKAVFERMLSFNPNDVRHGRSWEEMQKQEDEVRAQRRQSLH